MRCKVAKTAGFCGGVQKAFLMVKQEFQQKAKGARIFILGSLVHNNNVMKIVNGLGIRKIDSLAAVGKGDTVIITAHGVGKHVFEEIAQRGGKVFDATCPKVSAVQDCAQKHFNKGFKVVIFGDREHKEVKGINGWCQQQARIVANFQELAELTAEIGAGKIKKPLLLISQTTQNIQKFAKVKQQLTAAVKAAKGEIKVIDTICRATFVRQQEALQMARKLETVIVIGGRNSSNTRQLWRIVKGESAKAIWIEDPSELTLVENQKLLTGTKSIGIVSGASTSTEDIKRVQMLIESGVDQ